uniref:CCHC-type domain-containing protein n=1 Tax=Lactuca sativa TaxID=4236 RepID=A0A9R1WLG9_LACSA|nr:hypothetical protein LSAT_V11C100043120 [Lactuca sativa]
MNVVGETIGYTVTASINMTQKKYNKLLTNVEKIPQDEKEKLLCNVKAKRMIRFDLQYDTFRLVSPCTTAKEIWDRLKELYSTDEYLEHSIQTLLLSEFDAFQQKPNEKLIQAFDRFNHLLSKMIKHDIGREVIEQKVTLLNGLRPEWMVVASTAKAHEQFKIYSLVKMVGILKSHESVVTKEAKVVSSMGSLALLYKTKNVAEDEEESEMSECDLTSEEYAMMISNPKRLSRKKIPVAKKRNRKKRRRRANCSETPGYDCNFCHDKNHFAKDCMLRKISEKKEGEDDEAYHMRKLEEIKKKKAYNNSMNALIVQENVVDDKFGGAEVWSKDSEDEEMLDGDSRSVTNDGGSLMQTRLTNANLTDQISRVTSKSEERRMWIEKTELDLVRTRDELIYLQRDNFKFLKKRNIFCLIAKRLYLNITQLHLNCNIVKKVHKMILPFLEFKEDEVDVDCYNCESIVSSYEVSDAYRIGLDKIEFFIKSKDHKDMLRNLLDENDKLKIKTENTHKFDSLSAKLSSDNKMNVENSSEFDEDSDMSEISIEDEVDCSEFHKSEPKSAKPLISEN